MSQSSYTRPSFRTGFDAPDRGLKTRSVRLIKPIDAIDRITFPNDPRGSYTDSANQLRCSRRDDVQRSGMPFHGRGFQAHLDGRQGQPGLVAQPVEPFDPPSELPAFQSDGEGI